MTAVQKLFRSLTVAAALGAAVLGVACSSRAVDAVLDCDTSACAGNAGAMNGASGASGSTAAAGAAGESGGVRPIHRYSFDATGSEQVIDSIGERHGELIGARYGTDDAAGTVVFPGEATEEYVNLPRHLLWGLRNATFESWVTWSGGAPWQRVFDFGEDSSGVADSRSEQPRSYFFLAFKPQPRAVFKKPPVFGPEIVLEAGFAMPTGVLTHFAVVVDEENQRFSLYVNGLEEASKVFRESLSDIFDVNDWLGRSIYRADANLAGSISEFRIYDRALNAEQILRSYGAGPDAFPGG